MPGRPSVLLTTEGTYPFHKGGVSTWCDVLTRQLPEYNFTLCAVTMHPYLTKQYQAGAACQRFAGAAVGNRATL